MEKKTKTAAYRGGGEDFLIEILVRLPVVSLLRFKSVCKSWLDLIQTSFFIHLHTTFNSSSSSSNFGTFIVQASPYGKEDHEVFKVDDQLMLKLDNLELPSCYKLCSKYVIIAGSCNGLICLYDSKLRVFSLWNPATRQFRRLPKWILIEIDDDFFAFGPDFVAFGFDVKTKDHKVLLISYFEPKNRAQWPPGPPPKKTTKKSFCRVQVYSLSTDSWRLLEEGINSLPGPPMRRHHGVHGLYLNGSCFFVACFSNTDDRFLNSFDFTKEIFTTMQFPDHDHRHNLFLRCLGGEKIALFTTLRKTSSGYNAHDFDFQYGCYEDCDIWVLNEHGCSGCGGVNKVSWNKLHSFQIKNKRDVLPRGISNNGKFAFLETTDRSYYNSMQLYNLDTKEEEIMMDIPLCQRVSNVSVYKPSLVSIIGGNGAAAAPTIG